MEEEASDMVTQQCLEEIEIILEGNPEEGLKLAKQTLVGKILAEKNLNRGAVKEILSKAWNVDEELTITDLGPNVFLFAFSEKKQVVKVVQEGPWFVMGHLLSLQNWIPEASVFEVNYDFVSFWIQLHNLPLEMISAKNAVKLAGTIGEVLTVENPLVNGQLVRPFIRVRVKVNIKKPLVTGCWVPRKDLPRIWVQIRYERLQGFCYNCGVIGHENRKCKIKQVMAFFGPSRPKYGPSMGIPPARPISSIVAKNLSRIKKLKGQEATDVDNKETRTKAHHQPQDQTAEVQRVEQSQGQQTGEQTTQETRQNHQGSAFSEQVGPTNPSPPQFPTSDSVLKELILKATLISNYMDPKLAPLNPFAPNMAQTSHQSSLRSPICLAQT
ncbi:Zinc finger, CCHC-type [Sesbania bispinosa]|nr:Zinc finger, CCHC-type [Sesbania bispinosa]